MEITASAVVTTIGRPELQRALDSLNNQTKKFSKVIVKDGPGDTVSKMNEALAEVDTEVVVWADDDAVYPDKWAESLSRVFIDPKVSYAAGTLIPLSELDHDANDAEGCISEVSSSFFGTTNMSQRRKKGQKVKDADETNLMGVGMYRTSVMKEIFKDWQKIPPGFSETYVIQRMRMMGFKTLYVPGGYFYHKQRSNLLSFARQMFRCGTGRMRFFLMYPSEAAKKAYIFGPMIFTVYLFGFFFVNLFTPFSLSGLPLTAYVALLLLVSFGFNKYKSKWLPLYYLTMHLSYGAGMLYGLVRGSQRTWS